MILTWKSPRWFFPRSGFFQFIYGLLFSSFPCFNFNCPFKRYCFSTTIMNLTDTIILKKKFFVLFFTSET